MHQDEGKVVVKDDMLTRQSRKAVQSLRVVADIFHPAGLSLLVQFPNRVESPF